MIDSDLSGKLAIDTNGLSKLKQAAKDNSPEALKAVASQFEAMFVNLMLKSMRDATPQDGMFDNEQTRTFTSMLDQQLSQSIASRGIGLADIMTRQLTRTAGLNAAKPNGAAADAAVTSTAAGIGGANLDRPSSARPGTGSENSLRSGTVRNDAIRGDAGTGVAGSLSGGALSFHQMVSGHAEKVSRETGIPASFMIGQAALESGWGRREIRGLDGTTSNNLFGIKANASWKGKVVEAVTTEYLHGIKQKRIEKFRAYDSYAESFRDFAQLMQKNPRYENVMASLDSVHDYAKAIQKSGYATDPNYASKLISIVQKVAMT